MIQAAALRRQRMIVCGTLTLLALTIVAAMGMGYSSLSFDRLIPTLLGHGTFKEHFVLFSVRLPRIAITLLAGMALAMSGAILQGITRNELADPGIFGINAGAGAAVALLYLFVPIQTIAIAYWLPLAAFTGALLTTCLIYGAAYSRRSGLQPVRLVITGIGFATALSGLMIVLVSSADRVKVDFIAKWLAGSIWGTDWPYIWAVLPWLVILIPFTLYRANRLDLLTLSEPVAVGLGVALTKERLILLVSAVALAASAVSVTGGITFIGLMAPHIARRLVGPRHRLFLPVAVLLGGWILVLADTIGRQAAEPDGLPAGVVAALIGAPYFLFLLLRGRNVR